MAETVSDVTGVTVVEVEDISETASSAFVAEVEKKITSTVDMDLDISNTAEESAAENGDETKSKRGRDDEPDENVGGEEKRLKEDKSTEEVRMEKLVEKKGTTLVSLGPKSFGSSIEMFDFFYKLLHFWTVNLDLNKYEHMVLLELLKKGHPEPEKKLGNGVRSFQVRNHPEYRSRCFFILKEDGSADDFSFRKCVDHISPLPDNLKVKKDFGGRGGGGRGGRFGRCGRGGRR